VDRAHHIHDLDRGGALLGECVPAHRGCNARAGNLVREGGMVTLLRSDPRDASTW
jgi:hypothetical protein